MAGRILKNLIQYGVILVVFFAVWGLAHMWVGDDLLIPDVFSCIKEGFVLLGKGYFWTAFARTFVRVLVAFSVSAMLAAVLALIAYVKPSFAGVLSVLTSMMRTLPTMAVLLIFLVLTSASVAPVLVAFLSLFPMLYTGFYAALNEVDGELLEMSRAYNVPLKRKIMKLYLPCVTPYALRTLGSAFSFSLKWIVSAEVLAYTYRSLGGMMQEAKIYMEMPTLFALVLIVFCVGLLFETGFEWLARHAERRGK